MNQETSVIIWILQTLWFFIRRFLNHPTIISFFLNYPLGREPSSSFEQMWKLFTQGCTVPSFSKNGSKEEDVKRWWQRRSENLTRALGSGELKNWKHHWMCWSAKKQNINKSVNPIDYDWEISAKASKITTQAVITCGWMSWDCDFLVAWYLENH